MSRKSGPSTEDETVAPAQVDRERRGLLSRSALLLGTGVAAGAGILTASRPARADDPASYHAHFGNGAPAVDHGEIGDLYVEKHTAGGLTHPLAGQSLWVKATTYLSGANPFWRLMQTSLEVYNVKDYGAKGDGVSRDDVAIQAAIDAALGAPNENGGIVYLPAGLYRIEAGLTLRGDGYSPRSLIIQGAGIYSTQISVGVPLGDSPAFNAEGSSTSRRHVTLCDFAVDCDYKANTGLSLRYNNAGSAVERVCVYKTRGVVQLADSQGIWVKGGCYGLVLYNCQSTYNSGWGLRLGSPDECANHISVVGGDYTTNQGGNAWISGGRNILLDGVNLELSQKPEDTEKILHEGLWVDNCAGVTLNSCYFEASSGITSGSSQLSFFNCAGVVINGVDVSNWDDVGSPVPIILRAEKCKGLAINGFTVENALANAPRSSIYLSECMGVKISGFSTNVCSTANGAIWAENCVGLSIDAVSIANDRARLNTLGIEVGNCLGVVVNGGKIKNVGYGLLVKNRSDVTLSGVSFSDIDPITHVRSVPLCEYPIWTWSSNPITLWPAIVVQGIYQDEWNLSWNGNKFCSKTRYYRRLYDDMSQASGIKA